MHLIGQFAHRFLRDYTTLAISKRGFRLIKTDPKFSERARGLPFLPKRDALLDNLLGATTDARGKLGDMGFLVRVKENIHGSKASSKLMAVKIGISGGDLSSQAQHHFCRRIKSFTKDAIEAYCR